MSVSFLQVHLLIRGKNAKEASQSMDVVGMETRQRVLEARAVLVSATRVIQVRFRPLVA